MTDLTDSLNVLFTEFYYWVTVVMMFLIHVGFATYEVGVGRRKNLQHILVKNVMLIPVVTVTFFFFGWWIYFAFINGPLINAGMGIPSETSDPFYAWSPLMGPNMADRITGVFWAAFLLFSWTAASIVSGAIMERTRTGAFLLIAVLVGSVTWIIDAAWGWSPNGWMVQLLGYHDAYASGVIHAIAGGAALAALIVVGPRIGRFGPNGEPRAIPAHNVWMACLGLLIIYTGFWGFYAACNIPVLNVGTDGEPFFSATNIYLMPTTLSAITFNFLMSLSGGLMVGFLLSKGQPYWTLSCGLTGIIAASAGNDYYHPIQAMIVGGLGAIVAFKGHYYVERRFKIDDGVGAVAVHGYSGFFGVVVAGFLLWGYPAAAPLAGSAAPFFGVTPDGFPAVNPIGNIIGAVIMFAVLGFAPTYVVARILKAAGLIRVPAEAELAGLDTNTLDSSYPYFSRTYTDFELIEKQEAQSLFGRPSGPTGS